MFGASVLERVFDYAWEPKHRMRLDWEPASFAASPEWTTNEVVLRQLADLARALR